MFDSARDDAELAGLKDDSVPAAKLDDHLTAPDEEKLIFIFVVVPGKDATKFDELELLAVQRGHDFRPPMLLDGREFFVEGGFDHANLLFG